MLSCWENVIVITRKIYNVRLEKNLKKLLKTTPGPENVGKNSSFSQAPPYMIGTYR